MTVVAPHSSSVVSSSLVLTPATALAPSMKQTINAASQPELLVALAVTYVGALSYGLLQ